MCERCSEYEGRLRTARAEEDAHQAKAARYEAQARNLGYDTDAIATQYAAYGAARELHEDYALDAGLYSVDDDGATVCMEAEDLEALAASLRQRSLDDAFMPEERRSLRVDLKQTLRALDLARRSDALIVPPPV